MFITQTVRSLAVALARTLVAVPTGRREQGDVPGWVLITVMTAGLVAALWAVAGDALTGMLSDALSSVSG